MSKNRFTLGLTGGIGSGKTTVSNFFAECGAHIIDTDVIAHEICAPCGIAIPLIKNAFGEDFILTNGAMDRIKMRDLVFNNAHAREKLEQILHPLIQQQTQLALHEHHGYYSILVIPLLVESKRWIEKLSRIVVIDCEEESQITRVMQRNQFSREQVLRIISTQVSRQERLQYADDVINTEGDFSHIRHQVMLLHKKYMDLSSSLF